MPWRYVFKPTPSDNKIPLLQKLPKGFEESMSWGNFKTAKIPLEKLLEAHHKKKKVVNREFYYCRYCKGWIEGRPYEYHEDTIGLLCGRRGEVASCIRCGTEIGFSGMVS